MSRKFAKLYETSVGQVLVVRQSGDDGPEVAFSFDPGFEPLGVCTVKVGFSDDNRGNDLADVAFDKVTEEGAIKVASDHIAKLRDMFEEAA